MNSLVLVDLLVGVHCYAPCAPTVFVRFVVVVEFPRNERLHCLREKDSFVLRSITVVQILLDVSSPLGTANGREQNFGTMRAAVVFAAVVACAAAAHTYMSAVHYPNGTWTVEAGKCVDDPVQLRTWRSVAVCALCRCRRQDAAAFGYYDDAINETGWSFLNVEASVAASAADQVYAAGILEGYLSQERIYQVPFDEFVQHSTHWCVVRVCAVRLSVGHCCCCDAPQYWQNFGGHVEFPAAITNFISGQRDFLLSSVAANPTDAYWQHGAS